MIERAFGVFRCIRFLALLRDVASLVQFGKTSENIRLQLMFSLFRFVVFSAVHQTCVRGEHGEFASGVIQASIEA